MARAQVNRAADRERCAKIRALAGDIWLRHEMS
jgi:hypothetical protein